MNTPTKSVLDLIGPPPHPGYEWYAIVDGVALSLPCEIAEGQQISVAQRKISTKQDRIDTDDLVMGGGSR